MSRPDVHSLSVKRAQVEFHKFASLGEPERVIRGYAEVNQERAGLIEKHRAFIGPLSPFLEIGANAGHTSYLLANQFGAGGFALDLSEDALRYGAVLKDVWGLSRSPIRIAGDALRLPFRDASLSFVAAFQTLSRFADVEEVFVEVKRVLRPGGVFFFAEETLCRMLSLRLFQCPYYESMKPWERRLHDWGLLGFLVRDVIGAGQDESFGILLNHSLSLKRWHRVVEKHFAAHEYEILVSERGWLEAALKRAALWIDPSHSVWTAAHLLGGTMAAACRKEGVASEPPAEWSSRFESLLRCPDCHGALVRTPDETLQCTCGYRAPRQDGVYNLLPSVERSQLYPGERDDVIDMALPGHEKRLREGWHEVEGVYGNRYRWIGARAAVVLVRLSECPQRLRIRGYAPPACFEQGQAVRIAVDVNGSSAGSWSLSRTGLFVLEADLPPASDYRIEIQAAPVWRQPPDARELSVNLSMIRLTDRD